MNQVATSAMRHANASRLLHIKLLGTFSILWLVCLLAAYSPTSPSYSPTSPGSYCCKLQPCTVKDSVRPSWGLFVFLFCAYIPNFSFLEVQLLSFSESMMCDVVCTLSVCFKQSSILQQTL